MFGYNTTAGFVAGVGIAQLFNFIIMIGYEKNTKRFLSFQKNNQPSQKIGFLKKVPISVLTFSSSANVNYNLVFNSFVLVVFSFYQEMVAQTIKEVIVGREEYMAAPAPGETTNATETTWWEDAQQPRSQRFDLNTLIVPYPTTLDTVSFPFLFNTCKVQK